MIGCAIGAGERGCAIVTVHRLVAAKAAFVRPFPDADADVGEFEAGGKSRMKTLHALGSWTLVLSLAAGLSGCPKKDDAPKDESKTEAAKKSDNPKKKTEDKADDDDDKGKKADDGKKKKKIAKKTNDEEKGDSKKKVDADDKEAKTPPKDKKQNHLSDALPSSVEKHPVPKHWGTIYDDVRLFAFQVPDDSEIKSDETTCDMSSDGKCEYIEAYPPKPNDFEVDFFSFKDASLTQEDLVNAANAWFDADDKATDVHLDDPVRINKRSQLVHYTFTNAKGVKEKGSLLVFTDVSDNYFLFVETEVDAFEENKNTMDAVWQSFTIYGRDYE
ncbi:MAG: hypothetical protein NVS3B10_01280 [Polyangiales bacterium]